MKNNTVLIDVLCDFVKILCGAWLILNLTGCATEQQWTWRVDDSEMSQFKADESKCRGFAMLDPSRGVDLLVSCLLQKGYKLEALNN